MFICHDYNAFTILNRNKNEGLILEQVVVKMEHSNLKVTFIISEKTPWNVELNDFSTSCVHKRNTKSNVSVKKKKN